MNGEKTKKNATQNAANEQEKATGVYFLRKQENKTGAHCDVWLSAVLLKLGGYLLFVFIERIFWPFVASNGAKITAKFRFDLFKSNQDSPYEIGAASLLRIGAVRLLIWMLLIENIV